MSRAYFYQYYLYVEPTLQPLPKPILITTMTKEGLGSKNSFNWLDLYKTETGPRLRASYELVDKEETTFFAR